MNDEVFRLVKEHDASARVTSRAVMYAPDGTVSMSGFKSQEDILWR